jgi:hypothetical protein
MDSETAKVNRAIKRIQIAAYEAVGKATNDHAIISYAFMELALIIAIATRAGWLTKLEHRDRVLKAVSCVHDQAWEQTGDLFEKIRRGVR